jgi:hypothetical protein
VVCETLDSASEQPSHRFTPLQRGPLFAQNFPKEQTFITAVIVTIVSRSVTLLLHPYERINSLTKNIQSDQSPTRYNPQNLLSHVQVGDYIYMYTSARQSRNRFSDPRGVNARANPSRILGFTALHHCPPFGRRRLGEEATAQRFPRPLVKGVGTITPRNTSTPLRQRVNP